ncbi:MAG: vWA domain-containing protein [Mycobacteriales bacterium]
MTDELKTLLGDGEATAGEVARFTAPAEESSTVLVTDRWTKRAGERLAQQWHEAGVEIAPEPEVAADAVETLLSPGPRPAERPKDANRASWWKQLMQSPEANALRARTVASPAIAEIAAAELSKQWYAYAVEHSEPTDPENESAQDSVDRMRSTCEALKCAADAAETAEAVGAGLGLGNGVGLDAPKLAEYTRRLRGHATLVNIMRMAGRLIAKAQRLQRQRSDLPGMEITGVELSGDLARLLPVESSLIAGAVPELELLALARFTQRRALSYRRITRTPVAMGPIVVSLDESGSMAGDRIEAGKGLCLAMASIARAQKRPFALVAWSGTAEIRAVSDPSPDAIVEWLTQFYNGGTKLDGPLHTLPTTAWPAGPIGARSDHIIITDDDVGLPDELLASYQTWAKKMSVRTFGIGVGVRTTTTLARFCDGGVWAIPSLDLDNPALDVMLSIGPTDKDLT